MQLVRGIEAARRAFASRGLGAYEEADRSVVRSILAAVQRLGDEAVLDFTRRFDGPRLDGLAVPAEAFDEAVEAVAADLKEAIVEASERIRTFYRRQPLGGFIETDGDGLLGQLVRPLDRIGIYVPAGTAPLFSSLLMTAIPAQVAGVNQIVVATPPDRSGSVAPEILFTARHLGVAEVYRMGGAQAVAALAYGTATVPRVDKIVGPGNRFVVLAKREVFGEVGIESLPGPTETLVLADEHADVEHVVADLLAQAEHAGAQPVLVTNSEGLAADVVPALERALTDLPTAAVARASIDANGMIVVVSDLEEGLAVANLFAPEHLCLLTRRPWDLLAGVRNAGGVFLGAYSLEALGDYLAGPSHVMPTGGTARFSSFVNLRDFQKVIPVIGLQRSLVDRVGPAAAIMARAEGLEAHARAIELRLSHDER